VTAGPGTTSTADSLPAAVDLGDGTLLLRDHHAEIRLSGNRSRWWNGRTWVSVADCTPRNVRLDEKRERWWDGVEWRPRASVLPVWERHDVLAGLTATWLFWVVLMILGVLPGLVGLLLIAVVSLPGAVLTVKSKILRGNEKFLYLLSVFGLAILWVQSLTSGREAGAAADGSAHLQV
jgi:hypothetical protein